MNGGNNNTGITSWMDAIQPYIKSTGVYYCPDGPMQIGSSTEWNSGHNCDMANSGAMKSLAPGCAYSYAVNTAIVKPSLDDSATAGCTSSSHYD
jgi:hypothetical protein